MTQPAFEGELQVCWERLNNGFPQVREVFAACMEDAFMALSPEGVQAYLDEAHFLGRMGRGPEPILIFLEEWPSVARILGESALPMISDAVRILFKSPNGNAIAPMLQSLPAVARRWHSQDEIAGFLALVVEFMERTSTSIHGKQATIASPGLPEFFAKAPFLVTQLSLAGLKNWVEYGIRNYRTHPERQRDYFSLQSADSQAVLQRERHGTLLADHERQLSLYLRAMWQDDSMLVPYSTAFDQLRKPVPYVDDLGMRLPDVYDDLILPSSASGIEVGGEGSPISGLDRYRAALAHMAAHRRWTTPHLCRQLQPVPTHGSGVPGRLPRRASRDA